MTDTSTTPAGGKALVESKTFWLNVIAIGALVAQYLAGYNMSAEMQVSILAVLNIVLRLVTKDPIDW
jgi:hypothetical protein